MSSSPLPSELHGKTQAVIDIAPGGFPPLGKPSGKGPMPPHPGMHRHVDRVTGEVTTVVSTTEGDSGLPA